MNARLSWTSVYGSHVSAALYVRNLLDRQYYAGGNSEGATIGENTVVPGEPRMFGGELRYDF